jgi:hypothetical protein
VGVPEGVGGLVLVRVQSATGISESRVVIER